MEIKYKQYTIRPDYGTSWAIIETVVNSGKKNAENAGETYEVPVGYYSNLHLALMKLAKIEFANKAERIELSNLAETLRVHLESFENHMKEIINNSK